MKKKSGYIWKVGMFVLLGSALFIVTIYLVGKQKYLFVSTFHLKSEFKNVSGLKVGNNVRFSGINIGTVSTIEIITDTSVMVSLVIKKGVHQFIKTDAIASIGSDGLMGDKVLTISSGTSTGSPVKDDAIIASRNAIELTDVMGGLKTTVDNAALITDELAKFTNSMNNGEGTLSKLVSDKQLASSLKGTLTNLEKSTQQFAKFTTKLNDGTLDSTMAHLETGTKGLSDNMEAAKHNFLLRGFFKKKEKAEAKKAAAAKKLEEKNKKDDLKKADEAKRNN